VPRTTRTTTSMKAFTTTTTLPTMMMEKGVAAATITAPFPLFFPRDSWGRAAKRAHAGGRVVPGADDVAHESARRVSRRRGVASLLADRPKLISNHHH